MSSTLLEVGKQLHEPISPEQVHFLPKNPKQRGQKYQCLALAYYDAWYLANLLDRFAFKQWSTPVQQVLFSEQDARVIVLLTLEVGGITMTQVGEAFLDSADQNDENAINAAWAQAFKRACAFFGLGLGVYFLPPLASRYVAYDPQAKAIIEPEANLRNLAFTLYKRTPEFLLKGFVGCAGQDVTALEAALKEPFPPTQLEFLPRPGSRRQKEEGDWVCEPAAYVQVWALVRRLNAIAYGMWSVPKVEVRLVRNTVVVTVWLQIGEKIQVGSWQEPLIVAASQGKKAKKPEDATTTAYSYAFKRACQLHGLALYLRFLPALEVAYDDERKRIAGSLRDIAQELYRRGGIALETPLLSSAEREPALREIRQILGDDAGWQSDLCAKYEVPTLEELSTKQIANLLNRLQRASQPGTVSTKQMTRLRELCQTLKEDPPDQQTLSYTAAYKLIRRLDLRLQSSQIASATQPE